MSLTLVPVPLREANTWIAKHHRHHRPARGCLFCIGAADGSGVVGVAIVGRPVARHLQDGFTAEVTRLCVAIDPRREDKGHRNACSMLYAACWRAARAMGYRRIGTYTLPEEGGASLRGAGWKLIGEAGGGRWAREGRPRVDDHPLQAKLRWETSEAT